MSEVCGRGIAGQRRGQGEEKRWYWGGVMGGTLDWSAIFLVLKGGSWLCWG